MEGLKQLLAWCIVINYAILILWFVVFMIVRGPISRLHGKMFGVEPARINEMMYLAIAIYKILIVVLNLVPYIALRLL